MLRRPLLLAGIGSILLAACSSTPDEAEKAESSVATGKPNQELIVLPPLSQRRPRGPEAKDSIHEFAESMNVAVTPDTAGVWDSPSPAVRRWHVTIERPGSLSQNLGFTRYHMPQGGTLRLLDGNGKAIATFSDKNNKGHGQLWTPIVPGARVTAEVTVPTSLASSLELSLTKVNSGFRDFQGSEERSGSCNVDVVCSDGDGWRDEIRSAAVISLGGSRMCSGTLVNNTANDGRMLFLTADHCGVHEDNAASLVVYWNYQTSTCGGTPDGSLAHFQSGSTFLAGASASDFTLVELDDLPEPDFDVYWSGWDAREGVPGGAVAIHHPATDEKRISFENDPVTVTGYLKSETPGDGTHIRVADWDTGTTEPGSSGSGLWNPEHRLIGQLHGGYAACGNDRDDWYGWLHKSFDGPSPNQRARDWLDAANTGQAFVDGKGGCVRPTVDFTSTPNPANVGQAVTATSTASGGTGPYTYSWDMNGDGQADCTTADCSHTYANEYEGSINLTVSDSTGCKAIVRHAQTVTDPNLCPTTFDSADVPKVIPDNNQSGVASTLDVSAQGVATKAKISVKIDHTFIGDLRVTLIAPSGKEAVVHDRTGGGQDNLVLDNIDVPGVKGEAINGTWKLKVVDAANSDKGNLVSWKLSLRAPCQP